jgi:hypothetical protein
VFVSGIETFDGPVLDVHQEQALGHVLIILLDN